MDSILSNIDQIRQAISNATDVKHKAQLGQYFTPNRIATFMARLFEINSNSAYKILDAGAGIGSLSVALLERISLNPKIGHLSLTAIEYDHLLIETLDNNLNYFNINHSVINTNFIEWAKNEINSKQQYDLIILNPPYKKLSSTSNDKKILKSLGIEVVNYYTAFVALSLELLSENGQMVVILPRSFCNGVYFKPFRSFMLSRACIKYIHVFNSRQNVFQGEDILQENVILHLTKGCEQGKVQVSYSTDSNFNDLETNIFDFKDIVKNNDVDQFIHIPTKNYTNVFANTKFLTSLDDLGIQVSTGPVVDFRVKDELAFNVAVEKKYVPLLYPSHFNNQSIKSNCNKKPNFLLLNERTKKMVYRQGNYCVVRRFSIKEQSHRIVSHFVDENNFNLHEHLAFENHLNVFHVNKEGLKREVALGLTIYLNSQIVDQYFRQFSGHTQINVGDLKKLPYPKLQILEEIGIWASQFKSLTQKDIDQKINNIFY